MKQNIARFLCDGRAFWHI